MHIGKGRVEFGGYFGIDLIQALCYGFGLAKFHKLGERSCIEFTS